MSNNEKQQQPYRRQPPQTTDLSTDEYKVDKIDITNVDMSNKNIDYWKGITFAVYNWGKGWKQRYMHDHQQHLSQTLMQEEISNEFKGILRKKSEMSKFILEEVMVLFAAHKDIQEVMKEVRPREWFKFTKWIALTIVLGLFIFEAATNNNFATLLSNNAIWIALVAIAGVGLYLYWDRKSSK